MNSSRRNVILGLAAGAGAAVAAPAAGRPRGARPATVEVLKPDGRLPINRERAYRLMKEARVDALVGAGPFNSRYLTNMHSLLADFGDRNPIIGVMPADPTLPIIAIVPLVDIGRHSHPGREWPELVTYSAPSDAERYAGALAVPLTDEVAAATPRSRTSAASDKLTENERRWMANERSRPTSNAASPELALRHVLKQLGLTRGRVGIDEPAVAQALQQYGMSDTRFQPAGNLFQKLRVVKSAVEVDRMRIASRLNAESSRAMFATLQPGMTFEDVQAAFFTEVSRRGGRPALIAAGMVAGLRSGVLVKHEPLLMDCVGRFDGYCGDFGRTVVLGAPPAILEKRTKVIGRLAEASFELIKPGVSYSQVRERAAVLAKKLGADFNLGVGPHSVGMQHTDDPFRDDLPFAVRGDPILEAGMTITVDMPNQEPGWGSTHMESLILVTSDGAEWLDKHDDPLWEIPA